MSALDTGWGETIGRHAKPEVLGRPKATDGASRVGACNGGLREEAEKLPLHDGTGWRNLKLALGCDLSVRGLCGVWRPKLDALRHRRRDSLGKGGESGQQRLVKSLAPGGGRRAGPGDGYICTHDLPFYPHL